MLKPVLEQSRALPWKVGNKVIPCSTPLVMGIVNVTPDSFFDGGEAHSTTVEPHEQENS